jgi:hypothetical protein
MLVKPRRTKNKEKEDPLCLIVIIIMAPKKVTKGAPKRGEKVNPTDLRPKIVVETVNSPALSVEEVPFDAVDSPQLAVTTAATTMAQDDDDDEYVPVQFNPPQIRTLIRPRSALARKRGQQGVLLKRQA